LSATSERKGRKTAKKRRIAAFSTANMPFFYYHFALITSQVQHLQANINSLTMIVHLTQMLVKGYIFGMETALILIALAALLSRWIVPENFWKEAWGMFQEWRGK
jgi:hypothetical protein